MQLLYVTVTHILLYTSIHMYYDIKSQKGMLEKQVCLQHVRLMPLPLKL